MIVLVVAGAAYAQDVEGVKIDGPVIDNKIATGVQAYTVTSPFLGRPCRVDVLTPDVIDENRKYPVLYVLPVGGEWDAKPRWGNGLTELHKLDAANRCGVICVSMEFDTVPWFGSHATNPKIRHDEHLMKVVVPMIEARYPVSREPADRLLLGFSKSGWGAVSLLLRHPDFFGRACSWDAPMMMDQTDLRYGSAKHFGTPEHAEAYAPVNLVEKEAARFVDRPVRIALLGYDAFRPHVDRFHELLKTLRVPHHFANSERHKHHWESGWVSKALALMFGRHTPAP